MVIGTVCIVSGLQYHKHTVVVPAFCPDINVLINISKTWPKYCRCRGKR